VKSVRRFHVSTFGLSPDLKRVHPAFGNVNRGDVSRQTLRTVLEVFRQLESEFGPSASRFVIEAETGTYTVRVAAKQLLFGTEDQPPAQNVPLSLDEIMTRLEKRPTISLAPPRPPVESPWRTGITLALLCTGVVLIAFTLKSVFAPPAARPATDITLVTDPAELKTRLQAVTGIFATGQAMGDRHLTVSADGHVVFAELGARQSVAADADSYRIGRREQQTCLVTPRSGVIEAIDANTLVYYGDTYKRLK
jgi:hypothetical protein